MPHKHKNVKHLSKKYRRIAAAVAGVAAMAGAALPAIPAAPVQAAPAPETAAPPAAEQSAKNVPSQEQQAPTITPAKAAAKAHELKPSDTKAPEDFKQVINIKATAYAPGAQDNDQWGSKTHLGTQVRPGIIAVDPHVIPLGSLVYIRYPDGHGNYAVAEDTGGAIKGHRIDVARWTVQEAKDFGIQHVKVFVVKTPSDLAKA